VRLLSSALSSTATPCGSFCSPITASLAERDDPSMPATDPSPRPVRAPRLPALRPCSPCPATDARRSANHRLYPPPVQTRRLGSPGRMTHFAFFWLILSGEVCSQIVEAPSRSTRLRTAPTGRPQVRLSHLAGQGCSTITSALHRTPSAGPAWGAARLECHDATVSPVARPRPAPARHDRQRSAET